MNCSDVKEIWPIFVAESEEHLQFIGDGIVALERDPTDRATAQGVVRAVHTLKGSSATIGAHTIEELAHAIEDLLTRAGVGSPGASAFPAQPVLAAVAAIERAVASDGSLPEDEAAEVLAALRVGVAGPSLEAPPPGPRAKPNLAPASAELVERLRRAAAEIQTSFGALLGPDLEKRAKAAASCATLAARVREGAPPEIAATAGRLEAAFVRVIAGSADHAAVLDEAAEALIALEGFASPPSSAPAEAERARPPAPGQQAPAAVPGGDPFIRVAARAVDSLARQIDLWSLVEARQGRRARDALALERGLGDAVLRVQEALSRLRVGDVPGASRVLAGVRESIRAASNAVGNLGREVASDLDDQRLIGTVAREDVRDMRIFPASMALDPLRRTIREVAGRLGKEVDVVIEGGDAKFDRSVLDEIKAPLLHLVRNAVDHGLEAPEVRLAAGKCATGRIRIAVEPRGTSAAIVVEDDGRGLDHDRIRAVAAERGVVPAEEAASLPEADAIRLIFRSGFSTARSVSTISGRGVGLDVVQEAVTRMGGRVEVASTRGEGTRFTLELPVRLASTLGILVEVSGQVVALPADAVERVLRLPRDRIGADPAPATARVDEERLPYAPLASLLDIPAAAPAGAGRRQHVLVLAADGRRAVLGVDRVLSHEELGILSLGRALASMRHLVGAALRDDGAVIGVVNPRFLLEVLGAPAPRAEDRPRVLVADDAASTRTVYRRALEAAGYEVIQASDGEQALSMLGRLQCRLVVSDVEMPRMNGLELVRRVRADPRLVAVPVVLVSSLASDSDRAAGLAAGAASYLAKGEVTASALLDIAARLAPPR